MINRYIPYAWVIITVFFWGLSFVLAPIILQDLSPQWSAALRFTMAAIIMLIIVLWRGDPLLRACQQHWKIYLVLGFVGITGFNLFFFTAMQTARPETAALIMATNPLITAMIAALWLKDSLSWNTWMAIPLAFLGVAWVVTSGQPLQLASVTLNTGDGLMLLATIAWALYNVLAKRYLPTNMDAMVNTTWILFAGASFLLMIALFSDTWISTLPSIDTIIAMLVFVFGGTVFAYLFWNKSIERIGAGKTAIFMNLIPVFAFISVIGTGSFPSIAQWQGGVIIIGALLIGVMHKKG